MVKMKFMFIAIILILTFFIRTLSMAGTEVNYKEYKTINKTKEFNSYLKGIGEGLQWANEELAARGSKALYCKPQKEVTGIDEYTEILKREVSENAAELHDDMPVGLILLNGLMKRFPCK